MNRNGLVLAFLALFSAGHSIAHTVGTPEPYIRYDVNEHIHTPTDDREVLTQIFLSGGNSFGFRYEERVFGAIDPVVTAVEYSNENIDISQADQLAFSKALLDAGVLSLVDEPWPKGDERPYHAWLTIEIDGHEAEVNAFSRPTSGAQQAVDAVIRDFAKRLKADQPTDRKLATSTSEGDLEPARDLTFAELLANPGAYDGKRISVVGYFHGQFEGETFCADRAAVTKHRYDACIWRGEVSSFADRNLVSGKNDAWLRIDGVFHKGPTGHMGLWPGSIDRLTLAKPVAKP